MVGGEPLFDFFFFGFLFIFRLFLVLLSVAVVRGGHDSEATTDPFFLVVVSHLRLLSVLW